MTLTEEFKAEWVQALRSGEYEQGQQRLKKTQAGSPAQYCCLGVAGDLLTKTGACSWTGPRKDSLTSSESSYMDASTGVLLSDTRDLIGLEYHDMHTLITMNDDGASFYHIADWIEGNL